MKLFCFVNGIYSSQIGGGDIYFWNLFKDCPYDLHIFGGYHTVDFIWHQKLNCSYSVYHTDTLPCNFDARGLKGNIRLLYSHFKRMVKCLKSLHFISREDIAYGMSDYFFDVIPLVFCKAHRKIFYLGTMARKSTPLYWLSQRFSLLLFRLFCKNQIVTYSHPSMFSYLVKAGFKEWQLYYIPNGLDIETCNSVAMPEKKVFDVVWTGRIHPQKGIEDLVKILEMLYISYLHFKILLIGEAGKEIKARLVKSGLRAEDIAAPGVVSEKEKFCLLKSSKVFIFPSHYESFGISIGEALISGCNVVAYKLPCYNVFGMLTLSSVECFDVFEFVRKTKSALSSPPMFWINQQHLHWPSIREKFYNILKG